MVQPQQEALVARRIGAIPLGLHARDDYLERAGTPRKLAELAQHRFIGFDKETAFIRAMAKSLGSVPRDALVMRSDSDLVQLAAIRAGHGIGICQVPIARRDPRLVRLLPKQFALPLETWVTMHEDLRDSPRCRTTFDALVEGLSTYVASAR
jgi:DNA-binding transcriptional LysR family regulator